MTHQEKELFNAVPATEFNTYWIPCTWFVFRLQEAAKKGKLLNAYALETVMRVINWLKLNTLNMENKTKISFSFVREIQYSNHNFAFQDELKPSPY